jgi:hypothetical protein
MRQKVVKKLEAEIEDEVCKQALELGVTNAKLKSPSSRGYPDRIFFIPGGKPIFIEFKRPDGKLSRGQLIILRRLRHYGYRVEVCDNVKEAIAHIKAALESALVSEKSCKVPARTRKRRAVP